MIASIKRHNTKVNQCRRWVARRLDYVIDGCEIPGQLSAENFTRVKSARWGKRGFGVCGFRAKRMAMESKRSERWSPRIQRIRRNETMNPCAFPITAFSAECLMIAAHDYRIHVLNAEAVQP